MPSDPRDYKLELTSGAVPEDVSAATSAAGRPFLSVTFACCGVYARIYRSADGKQYAGHCPRCARPVRFLVGDGGTSHRRFVVS